MKELSIEEKAKCYDEVVNKLKRFITQGVDPLITRADVQDFFPELKESEDGKMKKIISDILFVDNDEIRKILESNDVLIQDVWAWLEKQGDNNMGISEATKQELEDNLNKALEKETPESCNEFLEKQGEKKYSTSQPIEGEFPYINPAETLDEEIENIWGNLSYENRFIAVKDGFHEVIVHFYNWMKKQGGQKPVNIDYISGIRKGLLNIEDNAENIVGLTESQWVAIRAAHRILGEYITKEQNLAWSEEDKAMLYFAIRAVGLCRQYAINHQVNGYSKLPDTSKRYEELQDWLKSLRPQPKQEWSNWDKTIIESIEALCDEKLESVVYQDVKQHVNDIKEWLKDLKDRYTWKPSEEQMKFLWKYAEQNNYDGRILGTLYDDLKKLREK